ncbi:hypothetical protein FOZ62_015294, partial [Perkinsus olseni]
YSRVWSCNGRLPAGTRPDGGPPDGILERCPFQNQWLGLCQIGPDACAKAVRAAAYLRQQYKIELDLYFTTAPEGVVAYDKGAAEEIWVGLEVAEGPPPFTALIDFEISSKTFPDKLAWAIASHLFRGESMRLTGIGPRSIIKMVTAVGIAAKWFDDNGRGVVLSRANSISVALPPGKMYEGRETDFSWATQISTRLVPTEQMKQIQ